MAQTLIDYLAGRFPTAKRQTLKRMVQAGRVRINDVAARTLGQPLNDADHVVIARPSLPRQIVPADLRIVYEDADLLVANKPPGLLTSTVAAERRPTLIALVRAYLAQSHSRARAGVVHRLDREAAGLLVFSKNHAAYRNLKEQFFRHSVERIYHAVVEGIVPEAQGCIESSLVEWPDGSVHSTRREDKGQRAVTQYQVVRQGGGRTLLRVQLLTGRKHQIRAHLSERGWPVVGDGVYGDKNKPRTSRLMLVAGKLAFDHPRSHKRLEFVLPFDPEMERLVP